MGMFVPFDGSVSTRVTRPHASRSVPAPPTWLLDSRYTRSWPARYVWSAASVTSQELPSPAGGPFVGSAVVVVNVVTAPFGVLYELSATLFGHGPGVLVSGGDW